MWKLFIISILVMVVISAACALGLTFASKFLEDLFFPIFIFILLNLIFWIPEVLLFFQKEEKALR